MVLASDSEGNSLAPPVQTVELPALPSADVAPLITPETDDSTTTGSDLWVGMQFTTGNYALTVTALGRYVISGDTDVDEVYLIDNNPAPGVTPVWVDVDTSEGTPGQFVYTQLPSPVTLLPNHVYDLVTYDPEHHDAYYESHSTATAGGDVTLDGELWGFDEEGFQGDVSTLNGGETYGFVNLEYSTAIPAAPSGLTATAGVGGVYLTWNSDDTTNVGGFEIERKDGANGTYNVITPPISDSSATSYFDENLTPGTDYYYQICASGLTADSGFSNVADAVPTAAPLPYSDDFDRADSTGLGDGWYQLPDEAPNDWNISNDEAVSTGGPGNNTFSIVNGLSATDVEVTATLTPGGGIATAAGLTAAHDE